MITAYTFSILLWSQASQKNALIVYLVAIKIVFVLNIKILLTKICIKVSTIVCLYIYLEKTIFWDRVIAERVLIPKSNLDCEKRVYLKKLTSVLYVAMPTGNPPDVIQKLLLCECRVVALHKADAHVSLTQWAAPQKTYACESSYTYGYRY